MADWPDTDITAIAATDDLHIAPFRADGEVDWAATEQHIENCIQSGADGIVVTGTTGETSTLTDPEKIQDALRQAQQMARQYRVPVVVECILEKVTNIAMGTEIDKINEFLGGNLNTAAMAEAVDPGLYRNRQPGRS